ncbi:MAG: hypothetical protein M1828_000706 [Chrysothrix sp. TS-e1954]|nr:MAG: hypothetical protein M1828_000706 [Chrysothrix sp. TS-e1954]
MPSPTASNTSSLPAPQQVAILTQKLYDPDSNIRYMSLKDLLTLLNSNAAAFLQQDYDQCAKTVQGFLHTLNDTNGEVQNLTIGCLGPFAVKADPTLLCPLIHKIANLTTENAVDSSISAMAVRAVVVALPRPTPSTIRSKPVNDSYDAISRVLIPRLVGRFVLPKQAVKGNPQPPKGLLVADMEQGIDNGSLDVLIEVVRCYGPILDSMEVSALQSISIELLGSRKTSSVMKKKAVAALSALSLHFSDEALSQVITQVLQNLTNPHLIASDRRLWIGVFGSLARSIPTKFGPNLKTLLPFVYSALSQGEIDDQAIRASEDEEIDPAADEVRETALFTLDSFLSSCEQDMLGQDQECVDVALRLLKYDPNVAMMDGDEDPDLLSEPDEFGSDEDFEEEGGADNEDDLSWKVRRSAAKLLQTIVSIRGRLLLENPELFDRIARALVDRFQEREETVRLEILRTLDLLIKSTSDDIEQLHALVANSIEEHLPPAGQTRKRRRGQSDASIHEAVKSRRLTGSVSPESWTPPLNESTANFRKVGSDIVRGTLRLAKSSTPATKQAAVSTLKDFIVARHGGLNDRMGEAFELLVNSIKPDNNGPLALTSASGTNLQIESLKLLSAMVKTHPSQDLEPFLGAIIRSVAHAAQASSPRTSCEALRSAEQLIKALTPPRAAHTKTKSAERLLQLRSTIVDLITAKSADLATRQQAIAVLGTMLGRTMNNHGSKMMSPTVKTQTFDLLSDTLRNETTRLASITAINTIGRLAPPQPDVDANWLGKTCLELGSQLRKADRSLRTRSLATLRTFITDRNCSSSLDKTSAKQLVELLIPLLTSEDLQLVGPTLTILTSMLQDADTQFALQHDFVRALCLLLTSQHASVLQEPLCDIVDVVGRHGASRPLMQSLLKDVGISGNPTVVGKVIGALAVASGNQADVKVNDFLSELKTTEDDQRKCLALSVLGEIGLRSGSSSSLSAPLFSDYFMNSSYDVSMAAAIALGQAAAGSGNAKSYVPIVLQKAGSQQQGDQYLALHSVKEILQHNDSIHDLSPYSQSMWSAAVQSSTSEDNRTIGAECIALLAMLDPDTYLQAIQDLLNDSAISKRSSAILALRDVFTNTDTSYNKHLRPLSTEVLMSSMRDSAIDNRRSALNTFNAAARNKPELVMPHIQTLFPLVLEQAHEDPSLIREVSMGPFKHKVDDGLEVRKSAYETLYSLLEGSPSRLDPAALLDRTIAGISDEASIRSISFLMILKLALIAPELTASRLDSMTDRFRQVLGVTLKDTAVRHEHDRANEAKRGVIKLSMELTRIFPDAIGTGQGRVPWTGYIEDLKKDYGNLVRDAERELIDRT